MDKLERGPVAVLAGPCSGAIEEFKATLNDTHVIDTTVPTSAIEFQYSDVIDPSTYETEGLCMGIALRRHRDISLEDRGAIRAQEDWTKLVGPIPDYKGGLGEKCSFMQVTVPECLPNRLEIISYANEFAFLYDDKMEIIDVHQFGERNRNHELLDVFGEDVMKHDSESKSRGEKQMQSRILSEMMAIDPERAVTAMKAWATFVELAAARPRSQPFATLEEYLPYRIIDAGEMLWYGTVTFGMGLTIPREELELSKQLARPGFAALSLTNDLYSWDKERDAANRDGLDHVVNAIWVIMRELSMTEVEAKRICRMKIKESVADFVRVVEEMRKSPQISLDTKKYVEAIQYSISGNLVWSSYCPRYNPQHPLYKPALS